MKAQFFSNGNTMFFDEAGQRPDLQKSWFGMYLNFLKSQGVDPKEVEFTLPDGSKPTVIKTDMGFNWGFN